MVAIILPVDFHDSCPAPPLLIVQLVQDVLLKAGLPPPSLNICKRKPQAIIASLRPYIYQLPALSPHQDLILLDLFQYHCYAVQLTR